MDEEQNNQAPEVSAPQWQYQSGQLETPSSPESGASSESDGPSIRWTASEFVSHEKSGMWYAQLAMVAIILSVIIFFVTKEVFSIIVVIVLAVALAVFGALKPRTLDYAIEPDGITVGDKHFTFETFRSFAIIEDGPVPNVQLLPQKRFMVPITIYFAPPDGDKIIEILGDFLPFEHKERDMVDKISSRIRF
jgi:hypothetical protein